MQINDKLRIRKLDKDNLILEELREVKSKKLETTIKKWCWYGYYSTVKSALKSALDKVIFDSVEQVEQIKDLINVIDSAEQRIIAAIEKGGEQC